MDRYVDLSSERDFARVINLDENSKNQTVLLVRTGDDSHLSAPINFEALRANGFCLHLARTVVPADVVRVSLANAINFVADLQQREGATFPQSRANLEKKRKAREWANMLLKKADEKEIDNDILTSIAVRRVKAAKMGETFEELESYPFNRCWR